MLNVPIRFGDEGAPRVVLVHGFTQAAEVWLQLARRLAERGYQVLAPDLPGHGETDPKYDTVDLWEAGRMLGETCGQGSYIGYSLGGRTLLHTALQPELPGTLVERMVLIGAKAGFRDPADAEARTQTDNALADRIELLGSEGRFHEFIDEWLQHPVNIRLPIEATHRDLRLRNRPEGLAESLRRCGSGPQEALWDKLASLEMPVLVTFAEFDTPTILQDNAGIASAIGDNARQVEFRGSGHSIPFEVPDAFERVVETFLQGEWPDGAH